MAWLHQRGVISSYDDYVGLPITVLEDCRLLMEYVENVQKMNKGGRNGV